MSTNTESKPSLERQRQYVEDARERGEDEGIVVGDAFVRGMRDLGYQSTAKALDELIDNSMQAEARNVHIAFGYDGKASEKKPTSLAVIDDGFGMIPEMLRFAVRWGGTDRENDRKGLGRYGYGLPSASVSIGERFRVYSQVARGEMHVITVDLQLIREAKGKDRIAALNPRPEVAVLPPWVAKYVETNLKNFSHGTIVVIDKIDNLSWKTRDPLKAALLHHTGLVYRNFFNKTSIFVDREMVCAIDPLFLRPKSRYFATDADRAEPILETRIEAKAEDGKAILGWVNVRMSYLPPTFGYQDKTLVGRKHNPRMVVMDEHEGIAVLRNGRQIEVVSRANFPKNARTFRNEDRYWQLELDFSAELDEEFSVTTSKQTVRVSNRIWALLQDAGIDREIIDLRARSEREWKALTDKLDKCSDTKRPSELAMENAQKFDATKRTPEDEKQEQAREEHLVQEATRRAAEAGVPVEAVIEGMRRDLQGRQFLVETRAERHGLFYRPEGLPGQNRLIINTAHEFYTHLYNGPGATREVRAALEVLLFVLANEELSARGEREDWYQSECFKWSESLRKALRALAKTIPEIENKRLAPLDDALQSEQAESADVA